MKKKFMELNKGYHISVPQKHVQYLRSLLKDAGCRYMEYNGQFILALSDILMLDDMLIDKDYKSDVNPNILDWSRREGNEHYYFGDNRKLIELFIKKSLSNMTDNNSIGCYDCLAPVKTSFVSRLQYVNLLRMHFKEHGNERGYTGREGKRLLHFQRLPLQSAIPKIIDFFKQHYGGADNELLAQLSYDTQIANKF
jgi:hypothetical protein